MLCYVRAVKAQFGRADRIGGVELRQIIRSCC
jgi:hypothetical protein